MSASPSEASPPLPIETYRPEVAPAPIPRVWRWCLVLAAIPSVLAVVQLGRIHPDEVYQFLEPAFFRVHGYGVMAWEWRQGLRNWAIPMLIAGLLRACEAVGIRHPVACRAVIELPQWVLHASALAAVFRYASRRGDVRSAWLATALVALTGTVVIYAGRTLGESISADFLLLGLEALDRERATAREGAWGGVFLGLSVVARYGSAVFVAAALGWLLARRRWRALAGCVAAGLVVALLLGALDWATWGAPFHSLVAYLRFNVFSSGASAQFGGQPPRYYVQPLFEQMPLWLVPGLWLAARSGRPRLSLPFVCGFLYLAALFLTPHKEARFLYPGLVVWMLGSAPAIASAALGAGTRRAAAVSAALIASLATFAFGPDVRGDQFRAIVEATRGDAHGLLIVNEGLWGAGGFFYIGKQLPWLTCDWPRDGAFQMAMRDRRFDRVVTFEGRALDELQAAGFHVVDRVGRETILAR